VNLPNLQSILTQNQQVQSRQETLDNIIYSVFPVVMLTEGVHAGSGGPVLYTAQTLANFHQTWNGTPVTLKHPDLNGTPVSANQPEIYKTQVVGTVFNTTFQDNKLKAELWLNEQKLEMLAPGLLNGLRVGMKLDVSTGLFDEGPKVTGNFNGQDYVAVAHNIRPDHLALLPGETGACSWKDGCGVRANIANTENKEGKEVKPKMRRRKPPVVNSTGIDENTEFIKQEEALIPLAFTINFGEELIHPSENKAKDPQSYQGIMDALRAALYPNDINGEVYHYIRAAYPDYIVYERESKFTGTKLFKKEYKMMDGKVEWTSEPVEVQQEITYKEIQTNVTANEINNKKNEENEMKTMRECCPAKVDELIKANAKFQETDKEMLLNMSEDAFARVIDLSAPTVVEKEVVKVVEKEVKVNAESKTFDELLANADPKLQESIQHGQRLVAQERENLVSRIKTNKANSFSDDELKAFSLDMLGKLAAMVPAPVNWAGNGGARQVINSEGVEPLPELEDAWKDAK